MSFLLFCWQCSYCTTVAFLCHPLTYLILPQPFLWAVCKYDIALWYQWVKRALKACSGWYKKRVIMQHYTSLMNSLVAGFWYSILFNHKYVCTVQAPDVFLLLCIQLQHRTDFKQNLTLTVFKKISRVMCLEYIFDYFSLNFTFWAEFKVLLYFVLICCYRMVQFGPCSSPGLRSLAKILCPNIYNSLLFHTVIASGDICCVPRGEVLHKISVVFVIISCIS